MGNGHHDKRWHINTRCYAALGTTSFVLALLVVLNSQLLRSLTGTKYQLPLTESKAGVTKLSYYNSWSEDLALGLKQQCNEHLSKHGSYKKGIPGTAFVTGAAGFIGFHVSAELKQQGWLVVGLDNFNAYYPVSLKRARAEELKRQSVEVVQGDLNDAELLGRMLATCHFSHVLHFAAQAGVRYAMRDPNSYIMSNVAGTVSLFEAVKVLEPKPRIIYASSSSVYGLNKETPFSEEHRVDSPSSLYAATKRSCELLAHVYHSLQALSMTGLRFFTVYGPWGRPDMAYMQFARAILAGHPIRMFMAPDGGELARDFTFVDDIVAGVIAAMEVTPRSVKGEAWLRVFNLGNTHPATVSEMVTMLESLLNHKARIQRLQLPKAGDVLSTHANISAAHVALGYQPHTNLREGLSHFVDWYLQYYGPDGSHLAADELGYKPD